MPRRKHRQRRHALTRAGDAYRKLVDHLPDGFARHEMVLDAGGRPVDYVFLDVNSMFETLTGFRRRDILGRRATEVVTGLRQAEFDWIGTYGRVALGGPSIRFEQFSEPLKRWYEVTVFSDQPGCFTTLFRDITLHRQMADELRTSCELLARSQGIAHVGSWSLDLTADRLTWSDETFRIFGLKPQEFATSYEAFLEAVHPDDRAAVNDAYTTSVREGRDGYEIEHRIVRRDNGETRCVYEKCVHERNETGAIVRSVGMVQDVTDRKRAVSALNETEERYRALFEQSLDAIYIGRPDGTVIDVNPAWLNLFGYTRDELPAFNIADAYVNPSDRRDFLSRMLSSGMVDDEVRLRRKDGTVFNCARTSIARRDAEGNVIALQAILRDVTAQKEAERALKESEEKHRALFEFSMDAIALVSPGGLLLEANRAYLELFGYTREDVGRLNVENQYADEGARTEFLEWMATHDYAMDQEVRLRKRDGTVMDCLRNVVVRRDSDGNVIGEQCVIRDITEQRRARAELEHLARFDALTGLANRRSITEKLDEWLLHVRRYGGHLCVAMADIDHFKRVNDEYGHRIGDRVLAETARVLQGAIRATDSVGRYGGEEFLIVLPGTDAAGAAVLAERLRSAVEGSPMRDAAGKPFSVTISLGVGERADGDDQDSLVTRADTALYRAKAAGRNRVEVAEAQDASG